MDVTPEPPVRVFSAPEASTLVPGLQFSLAAVGEIRQELEELLLELADGEPASLPAILTGERPAPPGREDEVERVRGLLGELGRAVEGIAELGVVVHDLDLGAIDFPAILDGRFVMLCWQAGEGGVDWFHEPGEGIEERHPLPNAHPMLH